MNPDKCDYGIFPRFEKYYIEDRKIWFISNFGNCLYEYEMGSSKEARILCVLPIPKRYYMKRPSVGAIVKCKSKIVIAPYMDEAFYVYDLTENRIETIPCQVTGRCKFGEGIRRGDDVFFIGCGKPVIAQLHTKDYSVQYHDSFQEEALSYGLHECFWSRGSCCMIEDRLFVINMNNPYLLEYAVEQGTYKFHKIENIKGGFNNILQTDGYMWLIPRQNDPIVRWDYSSGEIIQIENTDGFIICASQYSRLSSKYLWIMDVKNLGLYRMDTLEMKMREVKLPVKVSSYEDKRIGNRLLWMHGTGHSLLLYFYDSSLIYEISNELREINTYDVAFPENYLKDVYGRSFGAAELPEEGGYGFFSSLDVLFRYALKDEQAGICSDSNNGQRIHTRIMEGCI